MALNEWKGKSVSNGEGAKQSSRYTHGSGVASRALHAVYSHTGSTTDRGKEVWWEVDLRGYFTISNITLTAGNKSNTFMEQASVEVTDKDVSICSDVQVAWCGTVATRVAPREKFTFTCNATFPVRFVRVTRRSTNRTRLMIRLVDVQGEVAVKPHRSYYKPSWNKKVSMPFLTTSATTAGACGIVCHKHHSCIDFSYSANASTDENCLLTDKALHLHHVNANSWTTYTIYCM
ncbi:uncharacterized protein [Haliotis asinina]|uniref:uncharacterized protein isoform X2 n=1 Tax=Haliotis asinina TaxID=109174 RepID=UPI003532034E